MSLPAEILDHIFSFLQSDPASLDACRRSRSVLSRPAEQHLYGNITIQTRELNFKLGHQPLRVFGPENLNDLLSDSPHIASYVRSLQIHIFDFLNSHGVVMAYLMKIAFLLPRFPALRKIDLKLDRYLPDDQALTWCLLPTNFRLAFLDCLRLPSMRDIGITSMPLFPLSALNDCRDLRSLSLVKYVHAPSDAQLLEHAPYSALECLSIKDSAKTSIQIISKWMQTRSVRSLDFGNCYGQDFDNLPDLLTSCSNSLTSLHLRIGSGFRSYYNFNDLNGDDHRPYVSIPVVLSSLPYLKHVTISADLEYVDNPRVVSQWGFHSPIPAISKFLRSAPSLEHLTLDFHFIFEKYDCESVFFVEVFAFPLMRLLSETSSPSTNLRIRATEGSGRPIPHEFILHSFDCVELKRFVERGLLFITPALTESPVTARDPRGEALPDSHSFYNPGRPNAFRKWFTNITRFLCFRAS